MLTDFTVSSIKRSILEGKAGLDYLNRTFARFSCPKNPDVQRFLQRDSIDFTKRKQSVTYLVTSKTDDELLAYFVLAIKSISVNAEHFSNTMRRKIERISEVNEQTGEYLLAAYLIAQLGKNYTDGMNERITGEELLRLPLGKIQQLQDMAGGTVVFLETDNVDKLIAFYESNGFKQFAVRKRRTDERRGKLVQLLKVIWCGLYTADKLLHANYLPLAG